MKARLHSCLFMAWVSLSLCGAVFTVSDTPRVYGIGADKTVTVTAQTPFQDAVYPMSVGQPAFWLDASDTNGWTVAANGEVADIPSKSGARHLRNVAGTLGGWTGGGKGPTLTTDAVTFAGKHVIDFGDVGSGCFLAFDVDAEVNRNVMRNIGTIIQVRESSSGGGWIMGGGDGSASSASGNGNYMWHRGVSKVTGDQKWYGAPVANASHMQAVARDGSIWHHGFLSGPKVLGFDRGWETLSLQCTAATACATGLGINDGRNNHLRDSGGFRLAEMLIYDKVLTEEQIKQVELYLEQKWFGRNRAGWNGEARVGSVLLDSDATTPVVGTVNVPAGTTLTVERLEGGRLAAKGAVVRKVGAGALELRGAERYTGTVKLEEGSLKFGALKPTPVFADLPKGMYVHFDASDANSLVLADGANGTKTVSVWHNLSDTKYLGHNIVLRPMRTGSGMPPKFVADVFGPGMNVLDFGDNLPLASGCYMQFTTNTTIAIGGSSVAPLDSLGTVFAVIGAHRGGGNLLDVQAFQRKTLGTQAYDDPLYYHDIGNGPNAKNGTLWIDGRRCPAENGYSHSGYQVVAFEVPGGGSATYLGTPTAHTYAGGFRLAEFIAYDRPMSEAEILDVQAYLSKKWLKRATVGYTLGEAADGTACDVQTVESASRAGTEIFVAAGATNVIGRLVVNEPLRKTGAGTLLVNRLEVKGHGALSAVPEGAVKVVAGPDVKSSSEVASGATVHLDASDASTLELDGAKVIRWNNADDTVRGFGAHAYVNAACAPQLNASAACNGRSVVDFGVFGQSKMWMCLDRPLHAIRSVYAVVKYNGSGAFLLGSNVNAPAFDTSTYDFHPGYDASKGGYTVAAGLFYENNNVLAGLGELYTNGVSVTRKTPMPTDSYMLVELHVADALHASALAHDRHYEGANGAQDHRGGMCLGELVVYERELSAREKIATRNYLAKKWFGSDPQTLPPPEPVADLPLAGHEITVDGERVLDFAEDVKVNKLTGNGTFVKAGDGTLTLDHMSGFRGTLEIADGTVALTGADASVTPAFVSDGLIYRQDANLGISAAVTNADGSVSVTGWRDARGSDIVAVADTTDKPQLRMCDPDVGGLDTVDMPGGTKFVFQSGGKVRYVDGVRSVFWMIGSQRGGGFLLGGGTNRTDGSKCPWHRGQVAIGGTTYQGATNLCPMLHGSVSHKQARDAAWRINGQNGAWNTTHLSGGWDQLTMIVSRDADYVNLSGLAYDGRNKPQNDGNQRLGELLIYDRRLSDAERDGVESYLRCKWSQGLHEAATNVTVKVAAGATLDCGDAVQHVGGLVGAGSVVGSISADELFATVGATDCPEVSGTYHIAADMTVRVVGDLPEGRLDIPLVAASAFSGLENLASCTVDIDAATLDGRKVRVRVRKGVLTLSILPPGSLVIIR